MPRSLFAPFGTAEAVPFHEPFTSILGPYEAMSVGEFRENNPQQNLGAMA
jgi:hypothetical protein